jgi:hypothetical protein
MDTIEKATCKEEYESQMQKNNGEQLDNFTQNLK